PRGPQSFQCASHDVPAGASLAPTAGGSQVASATRPLLSQLTGPSMSVVATGAPTSTRTSPPRRSSWRRRLPALLAILGPGLIAGAAGDDAGGIATYASVGAQYGYSLLWALIEITVSLIVVQLQVARLGVVTGKGLAELILEEFGVRWTALAMLVLLIANGAVTVAEFAGIAAAGELFGI